MLTKESLEAEVKELRDQFQKAQQQLLLAKQQSEDLQSTVERLQGAIIVTEKYMGQMGEAAPQTGPQMPAPNSHLPAPVGS